MNQRVWAAGATMQQQPATGSTSRQPPGHQFRLLLVAAPWPLFNRPSLQLAALRSYLVEQGGFHVDNRHLYLAVAKRIGTDLYARIARSGWAGEALFAPLLFPEQIQGAARLFRRELAADGDGAVPPTNRSLRLFVTVARSLSAESIGRSFPWLGSPSVSISCLARSIWPNGSREKDLFPWSSEALRAPGRSGRS